MKQTYIKPQAENYPLVTNRILEISGPTGGDSGNEGDHGQAKEDIILPDDVDNEFGW